MQKEKTVNRSRFKEKDPFSKDSGKNSRVNLERASIAMSVASLIRTSNVESTLAFQSGATSPLTTNSRISGYPSWVYQYQIILTSTLHCLARTQASFNNHTYWLQAISLHGSCWESSDMLPPKLNNFCTKR